MKKETKEMLVNMINAWNMYNPQKSVDAHFDDSEFSPNHWSLDVAFSHVICSDFIAFLLPALQVNNCVWFMHGSNDNVCFHIQ